MMDVEKAWRIVDRIMGAVMWATLIGGPLWIIARCLVG